MTATKMKLAFSDYSSTIKEYVPELRPSKFSSMEHKVLLLLGIICLSYFIWMDVAMYNHIQTREVGAQFKKVPAGADVTYTPFTQLTAKLIMTDPIDHYVLLRLATVFEDITHLSKTFVTPNMVTGLHLFVSLISAKLVCSDNLSTRRWGAFLYVFRTWLDNLDGVLFRATKPNLKYKVTTVEGTFGYYADIVSDISSGIFLVAACLIYLLKNPPKRYQQLLPLWKNSNGRESPRDSVDGTASNDNCNGTYSSSTYATPKRIIWIRCVFMGIMLLLCSPTWNNFTQDYQHYLDSTKATKQQQIIQDMIYKQNSTWQIFWFWRWSNGCAILFWTCAAIFIDKIWEFFILVQYAGIPAMALLLTFTHFHLRYVIATIGPLQ